MIEWRAHRRNLCSDIVELFWSDGLGWPHRTRAILEDISVGGACLQTDAKLAVNADVAIRLRESGYAGQVRYCTLVGGNYFVGIEFIDGSSWMPGNCDPKHMLGFSLSEEETATLVASGM